MKTTTLGKSGGRCFTKAARLDAMFRSGEGSLSLFLSEDSREAVHDAKTSLLMDRLRHELLPLLTERQKSAVLLYVEHGLSEASRLYGCSHGNVLSIVKACMTKFRRHLDGKQVVTNPAQIRRGGITMVEVKTEVKVIQDAVAKERRIQLTQHSLADDDKNTISQWVGVLVKHVGRAMADGRPDDSCPERFRAQMVKVMAVAQAAVEAVDRRRQPTGLERLVEMAQNMADQFGEPCLVLPAGCKQTGSTGTVSEGKMACAVLLSRATAEEVVQASHRLEPRGKR